MYIDHIIYGFPRTGTNFLSHCLSNIAGKHIDVTHSIDPSTFFLKTDNFDYLTLNKDTKIFTILRRPEDTLISNIYVDMEGSVKDFASITNNDIIETSMSYIKQQKIYFDSIENNDIILVCFEDFTKKNTEFFKNFTKEHFPEKIEHVNKSLFFIDPLLYIKKNTMPKRLPREYSSFRNDIKSLVYSDKRIQDEIKYDKERYLNFYKNI
jgi:hypothetical protein